MEVHGGPAKRKRRTQPKFEPVIFLSPEQQQQHALFVAGQTPLSDITDFSLRVVNILEKNKIFTLADLAKLTVESAKAIQNLGEKTVETCIKVLNRKNIPHKLSVK